MNDQNINVNKSFLFPIYLFCASAVLYLSSRFDILLLQQDKTYPESCFLYLFLSALLFWQRWFFREKRYYGVASVLVSAAPVLASWPGYSTILSIYRLTIP